MWRTTCQDCTARVYFFSCSCGSRVFFESPGEPWPLHARTCVPYQIRQFRARGVSAQETKRLIEAAAVERGVDVPPAVLDRLQRDIFSETGKETVVSVVPEGDSEEIEGQIISEARQVNFFKRLSYPENPVSRGFLGKLVSEPHVELRLRADADPDYGYAAEVTCFLPFSVYKSRALRVRKRCHVWLVAHRLPNDTEVWLVARIRDPG